MMTPIRHDALDDFIILCEYGVIDHDANIRYLKVNFCTEAYSDELFAEYSIQKPANLANAVTKRKAEYLAGRYCCALLLIGFSAPYEVTSHEDRSPCWPAGMSGTISHCAVSGDYSQAIAIVTDRPRLCLGADIEVLNRKVLHEISQTFTLPEERERLQTLPLDFDFCLLLAFSAKESLFKALYPQVKSFFGFEYAAIDSINLKDNTFILRLNKGLSDALEPGMKIKGSYDFDGRIIITTIILEQQVLRK